MSSLDECLILDSLNLEVNLQREAIHFGSRSQNDGRMNLSLSRSVLRTSLAGHELKGAQKARWNTINTRAIFPKSERGFTSISHSEELFGILAISLSTDALWGCQFQAQRDVAVRFNGAVTTLPDGGSIGDILTTRSVRCLSRERARSTHQRVFNGNYRPSGDEGERPSKSQAGSSGDKHRVRRQTELAQRSMEYGDHLTADHGYDAQPYKKAPANSGCLSKQQ